MSESSPAEFGLAGMGVMGQNLALNLADHGVSVLGWDREPEVLTRFAQAQAQHPKLSTEADLARFVARLSRPRRILLMVTAGAPVDAMLERLQPLLAEGDVVMDGGNSWFEDSERREKSLAQRGLHFVGMGVSGGEEGARHGPSLMPGGSEEAYGRLRPILEAIAARPDSGPCVTHVGPGGAGHFVKMVHNGIEYADMQLLAESYDVLRRALGMSAGAIADLFAEWNQGIAESFLLETTVRVLRTRDPKTGTPLIDAVLDQAGQKGTGKWTVKAALDLGVPVPSIAAALDARVLSSMKAERMAASRLIEGPRAKLSAEDQAALPRWLHDALYASRVCTYAQGMRLIQQASQHAGWHISLAEMARIWRGGCIIRARLLTPLREAFLAEPHLPNLMLSSLFAGELVKKMESTRELLRCATRMGLPVPAFAATLAYFDSYRSPELPQNLTQAQRDAFGAHTYQRKDSPERGFVHSDWSGTH